MTTLLVNRFIDTVEKYGQKTAIVDYPDGSTRRNTSFDDLLMFSRQVASYIKERNIAPQSFITIELAAGADFLVAEMGVWMARCVVVPVGLAFPEERKAYIRQHSEVALNIDSEASPKQLLKNVRNAVNKFVKEAEQFDDLTMMCLEYKGSEPLDSKQEK